MLKHKDIIDQLSERDKIHILSDIRELSDSKYRLLNIPAVKLGALDERCHRKYPSIVSMANSWDTELVGEVAEELAGELVDDRVNLAIVNGPKVKLDPYRKAISEDPLLASRMSSELIRAVDKCGINVSLGGFGIRTDEARWLDDEPNERFIAEYLATPYAECAKGTSICALLTRSDISHRGYESVNSAIAKRAESISEGAYAICREVPTQRTVRHIADGGMLFEGSAVALESAMNRYKNLKKAIKHNTATEEELQKEISAGRAISPEVIDEALDKLLEFVFSIKREYVPFTRKLDAELPMRAVRDSIVLLKNKGILPLTKKGVKLALVGDIVMEGETDSSAVISYKEAFAQGGINVIGAARGYDISRDRSEELVDEAIELVEQADVAIVFLGLGAQRERLSAKSGKISLPANQQDLLKRLDEHNGKIIAVCGGDCCPDAVYYNSISALVFAPLQTDACANALTRIILGEISPSGRLASTVYYDSESLYDNKRKCARRYGIRTGPFFGYRYYDTADITAGYPFGHGLSYTRFAYSHLSCDSSTATLTVKNTGKLAGAEVVQIYVGANSSSVMRPKKELAGFKKIWLEAGESATVSVPIKIPQVYDADSASVVTERGDYTVYAGASVSDIRLSARIEAGDTVINGDGESVSDYIQSESNIISDKYKLEEEVITMRRKSVFNFIAGSVFMLLAIILKLYCVFNDVEEVFFDLLACTLGVIGIVFFVVEAIYRNKDYHEDREKLDKINQESFSEAEEIPFYAANRMFVNEFDVADDEPEQTVSTELDGIDEQYHLYIDSEQTFANAAREFELFAAEKAHKISSSTAREIFSAMASTRLILVRDMEERAFKDLLMLLGGYFETTSYFDKTNASYTSPESVLFKDDGQGGRAKTNAYLCIEEARNAPQSIHFAGFSGADANTLNLSFGPIAAYAKNPNGAHKIVAHNESFAETSYYIPKNVWFVVNVSGSEGLNKISEAILEASTVNTVRISACDSVPHHEGIKKFSYYQMEYLVERLGADFDVDEDDWKKLDRLEEYVNSYSSYSIGNKMWLCLERYSAVYLACGGEKTEALDMGICSKLLPSMISVVAGKIKKDEKKFSEALEDILGEDSVNACKMLVRSCGADVA